MCLHVSRIFFFWYTLSQISSISTANAKWSKYFTIFIHVLNDIKVLSRNNQNYEVIFNPLSDERSAPNLPSMVLGCAVKMEGSTTKRVLSTMSVTFSDVRTLRAPSLTFS